MNMTKVMEERMFQKISHPEVECLSCKQKIEQVFPQCLPYTGNCLNCGNFIVFSDNPRKVISQSLKEENFSFKPEIDLNQAIKSASKTVSQFGNKVITGVYNPQSKYLRYRSQNIKQLFQVSERFGFKPATVHLSVAIYDHFLQVDQMVDRLRVTYESCKGVVSEQIATFVASVSLFLGSKYAEIKYPVVEDVCALMGCPFSFNEFIEMEKIILQIYEWNLQLPTTLDIMSTFLSQGVLFQTDSIIFEINKGDTVNVKVIKLIDL
jgi:hypothetical protein